jgi:aspartyl-tRNA(Asn)/glutamyl-tRNA(Gln) amidotransferase subunit A
MISRRVLLGSAAVAVSGLRAASEDLAWISAADAARLLRRKEVSPVELTQLCLRRIDRLNSRLNAFVTVTADTALQQAKAMEAEGHAGQWRGPLHGVPIGLKDLYDTAGTRTTAGSRQWSDRVPDTDAEVVRRLKNAGAIVVGKLNMDEFAYNYTGETSSFGASRNPWDTTRSPGGSSGGSAVAVASGLCYAALGSDTGGSIRLPAALCGVTGFKPTYGSVSTSGVAPLAWSLDHVGPLCRTAVDAAAVHEALSGAPVAMDSVDVPGLRLGVPRALFFEGIDPAVQRTIEAAVERLGSLTAGARDLVLPEMPMSSSVPDLPETYIRIISAEAYAFHHDMLRSHPERFQAGTRKSIEMGASVAAAQYILARREMDRLRSESSRFFPGVDLLLTPTAPGAAFEFGTGRLVFLRNTAPWNLLGLPAISVPCGFTAARLPIGLQITGQAGRDDVVLALAAAWQKESDWHQRRPPVD